MLLHFIKKEILDSLLNLRFMTLAVFSIVLMPLSGYINFEYFQERRASFDSQYNEYQSEGERARSMRAYRAPVLLSTLARGTEPYMPIYYAFSDDAGATQPGNIEAQDFSTLSTFGNFDFLFLVQIVFSLLAVLLAFDMVAGEKERGTLRAVLANRVPRDHILLGKFFGGFSVLWLTFIIGLLLLFLVLAVFDSRFLEGDVLIRLLFIFGYSSLFLAAFYGLGLMVSTFCYTTRTAIVVLLIIWVVLQLVIPKAGEKVAAVILPVRSEESVRIEKEKVMEDLQDEQDNRAGEIFTRITGKTDFEDAFQMLGSETPEATQFKAEYQEMAANYEREQRDRVREINQQYAREKELQRRLSRAIALLSPAPALTFLVTDAVGTGDLAYQNYRDGVLSHYQVIDRVVFSKQRSERYRVRLGNSMISSNFGDDDDVNYDEIPTFTVPNPALGDVIASNVWAVGTLLLYLIIPFLVAYVAFLRYDVR